MARILGGPRNRRARHGPRAVGAADGTSGTAVARGFGRTTARWRPTHARRGGQELAGRLSATSFERHEELHDTAREKVAAAEGTGDGGPERLQARGSGR